jgi:Prokaryotic Cytochrome C oxidase subunit IV
MPVLSLLRSPVTAVWSLLIGATLLSWWLGTDHGLSSGGDHTLPTLAILVVAFFKLRCVGLYFMELRDAPLPLRLAFEGYVVVVCGAVIGLYLSGQ